jgi:hypothetical protein
LSLLSISKNAKDSDDDNTQNYWVLGLCSSLGTSKNRKGKNVLNTGCLHPQVRRWDISTMLGPLERHDLNQEATYVNITTVI